MTYYKMPPNDTSHLSLRSIDPELRERLRELHKTVPAWNAVCLLYPGLWAAAVWLDVTFASWWSATVSVIVIGVSIQALAIIMHEALHGNLFRRVGLDRAVAFAFGAPAFFSGAAYRVAHLHRHRHTRTETDQDELSNYCKTPAQYRALFYAWFFIGTWVYIFIVPLKAWKIAKPADRRRILLEYGTMAVVFTMVVTWCVLAGQLAALFWYWLIPAQVAIVLSNVRGLSEHLGTQFGNALSRTRTTKSTRLVSFLMLNLNYHLEHHLFPGIPWYNLQKAHRLLLPLYERSEVTIEGSYLGYAWRAFWRGPEIPETIRQAT